MRHRLLHFLRILRESFWFLPGSMVLAAFALAFGLGWVDLRLAQGEFAWPSWLEVHGVENVRALLTTMAGSMMTVAGVTFSIVIVALAQASTQFGPRLLRQFMRDRGNQITLGTYVSTFVYCVLVLGQIHPSTEGSPYLPRLSALMAVALALASIGVLVFFFHHVASSIQADQVILRAAEALEATVDSVLPERGDDVGSDGGGADRARPAGEGEPLASARSGYLGGIDVEGLAARAAKADVVVELEVEEGGFVLEGRPLAGVHGAAGIDDELAADLRGSFQIVHRRSTSDDLHVAIDRLAEIAIRALSPGVNDPFTAVAAIDRLGAALASIAERSLGDREVVEVDGEVRVVLKPLTWDGLVDHAFLQIAHYGRDNLLVQVRLLEALTMIGSLGRSDELSVALRRMAGMIARNGEQFLTHDHERRVVAEQLAAFERALQSTPAPRETIST